MKKTKFDVKTKRIDNFTHLSRMKSVYVKETILKQLPSDFGHRTVPILFAEAGMVPNSKGKASSCLIFINMSGISFFKAKTFKHHLKLIHFISIFAIDEIQYIDPKRRDISYGKESYYFICDHADDAVAQLLASKSYLLANSSERYPIKLTTFPYKLDMINLNVSKEYISTLRYVCLSLRYGLTPDESIINLFNLVNPKHNKTLQLDEKCDSPTVLDCLVQPIINIEGITTIHFKGFAKYAVCRLAHYFAKKSKAIRTFIFDSYDNFIPQQLRLNKLESKLPITFIFTHCSLSEKVLNELLIELNKFNGEYQRITFNSIQFTQDSFNFFFDSILKNRCYRTLEMLEFDNIDSKNLLNDSITNGIISTFVHCRFLQNISFSNWSTQLSLGFELFTSSSTLSKIVLSHQNLSRPFSISFRLPPSVYLLDFSGCNFTFSSIQSLFKNLSDYHSPLYLNLSEINLPEAHWDAFFDSLKEPLTCLRELNWSGNKIPKESIPLFVKYFIEKSPIRYLSIDKIYNPSKFNELKELFSLFPKGKLWGISLGGDTNNNFSYNFKLLIQILDMIQFTFLNINGQKMTDNDADLLIQYLKNNSSICELSCDDSNISSLTKFYKFYDELIQVKLTAIGKPYIDLKRLIGDNEGNLATKKFEDFRTSLQGKQNAISQHLRAYYLCRINPRNELDLDDLFQCSQSYSQAFFSYELYDKYSLSSVLSENSMMSLLQMNSSNNEELTLGEIQAKRLSSPMSYPKYTPSGQTNERSLYSSSQDNFQTCNQLNHDFIANYKVQLEPISKAPEMKEVIELLANSGFDYDESEEEDEEGLNLPNNLINVDVFSVENPTIKAMNQSLAESGSLSDFQIEMKDDDIMDNTIIDNDDIYISQIPPLEFYPYNYNLDKYYTKDSIQEILNKTVSVPSDYLQSPDDEEEYLDPLKNRNRNYPPVINLVESINW